MKFATLVALVASADAARIMSRDAAPEETQPVELAETDEAAMVDAQVEGIADYSTRNYT